MHIENRSLVHEPMIEKGYAWENLQLVFTGGHYEWLRCSPNTSADAENEIWLIHAISKDPFISQSISGGEAGVCQSLCKWVCTYLMHDSEFLVALLFFCLISFSWSFSEEKWGRSTITYRVCAVQLAWLCKKAF